MSSQFRRDMNMKKKINWQDVINGSLDSVKASVEKGHADVNNPLLNGWTALMYACREHHAEMVRYLLSKGANPNCHKDMFTALMCACSQPCKGDGSDCEKCVDLLIQHGAVVDEMDRFHTTALMFASRSGNGKIIRKLVCDHGAQVNAQDSYGDTALTIASSKGYASAVEALCQVGARVDIRTNNGYTAIALAEEKRYNMIADVLAKYQQTEAQSVDVMGGGDGSHADTALDATNGPIVNGVQDSGDTDDHGNEEAVPCKEDDQQPQAPPQLSRPYQSSDVMYGPLELFLSGLNLADYTQYFDNNRITFPQLLSADDDDLVKIGIKEYGVRLKILEGIREWHKAEFRPASLVQPTRTVNNLEAISIMSNISKHVALMSSSVGYLHAQLTAHEHILRGCSSDADVNVLVTRCDAAARNLRHMYADVTQLRQYLNELKGCPQYTPADLITAPSAPPPSSTLGRLARYACVTGMVAAGIVTTYCIVTRLQRRAQ